MATSEFEAPYGITVRELKDLMELKALEFKQKLYDDFGGMEELANRLRTNLNDDEDDNSSSNFPFQNDEFNLANELTNLNRLRFTELESFFTDISQINQFEYNLNE